VDEPAAPASLGATLLALFLATLLAVGTTILAFGPRSLAEAKAGWRSLSPQTPAEAEAEIARIGAMRRDPEIANMVFLARFIVMIVQESVGQLLTGALAAWPATARVSDKIIGLPFALAALWLALLCLVIYRRITRFERWSADLRARTLSRLGEGRTEGPG
jgi:hypothetical protein